MYRMLERLETKPTTQRKEKQMRQPERSTNATNNWINVSSHLALSCATESVQLLIGCYTSGYDYNWHGQLHKLLRIGVPNTKTSDL